MEGTNWVDVVQTTAVVIALVFTGWEFRAKAREQKFRNYLDTMAGYLDLAKLLIEREELYELYCRTGKPLEGEYEDLTSAQRARINYCDAIIALCETIWYAHQDRWLASDEWRYWERWLVQLRGSPEFQWTLKWVQEDYDPQFIAAVNQALAAADKAAATATKALPGQG